MIQHILDSVEIGAWHSNVGRPHFTSPASYFPVFVPVLLQLARELFGLGLLSRGTVKVLVTVVSEGMEAKNKELRPDF